MRVFLLDGETLLENRRRLQEGGSACSALEAPLAALLKDADAKLSAGPFSVTAKAHVPPSGDKRDYCSQGRYWWPDPAKPDGLPYIRRDGQPNPDRAKMEDAGRRNSMQKAVVTLSHAWFFTQREEYAARAAKLLRVWFLNPEKRMNPHLRYAQGIPGQCEGRGIGIVDFANLVELVDAVGLLSGASAWTAEDQEGLVQWFTEFLQWLQTSKHGHEADHMKNNHATQYDAQLISYALFVDKPEIARQVAEAGKRRIETQIRADGTQPQELSRATSWDYCCENLRNFGRLARLASHVDVDLWAWTSKGRSIPRAVDYLLPFAAGEVWPHKQSHDFQAWRLKPVLLLAPQHLGYGAVGLRMLPKSSAERLLCRGKPSPDPEPLEPVAPVEPVVDPEEPVEPEEPLDPEEPLASAAEEENGPD
ncbi:unnamed protein product [Effrenium voratum]|uniref:Alginate lyase domain-containing protein n=1 Tax=Effrenium voratum TaxID=2562239 RepID=A0AA36IK12_9DINO|nr:unnamed protein product [Effrenium voratum]CAJ1418170.1 unnamed protein product [Effrenium voratum]